MITIPKQHYVGFSNRYGSEVPLGFATPYEDNAAFIKRKSTVDSWSDKKTPAKIVDNELLNGFEISRSVRRYGWGRGNVVWRIVDPRGFELEISSSNFARIVDCTTIVNGVIQQKCIWGRDGANNVLLPENSEPYVTATKNTVRVSTSVGAKELTPGDIVVMKTGERMQYCGLYHIVAASEKRDSNYSYYEQKQTTTVSVKKRYVFINLSQPDKFDPFELMSNLNVSSIEQKAEQPLDTKQIALQLTQSFPQKNCGLYGAIFASDATIKPKDLTFAGQPTTLYEMTRMLDMCRYGYHQWISFVYDNTMYRIDSKHEDSYRNNMVRMEGHAILSGDFSQDAVVIRQNYRHYNDHRRPIIVNGDRIWMYSSELREDMISNIQQWMVSYKGQSYPVIS